MNEKRLRALLRESPVPAEAEAERRGLRIVSEAFAQRQPRRKPALPRLAVALAATTLLAAVVLSPAGATVRDWIDDVLASGVPDAEPALTEVPGGGRLLVQSASGPWVVQPDGGRRLLGPYEEATWSPRGLFVAATRGHTLSAIEPGGTVRWSRSADAPAADPRWSSSGFQIAYRAGRELRVIAGDGSDDALLDRAVKPVPSAWSPLGLPLLAYVSAAAELRIAQAESAETLVAVAALPGIAALDWARDGSRLLEASPAALRLRELTVRKVAAGLRVGSARRLPLPAGATLRGAAFSPDGATIAALLVQRHGEARAPQSEVVLIDARDGSRRRLFGAPGLLSGLAWSPSGSRLLIAWPKADQWLFIPASGRGRVRAIGGISAEFAPGASSPPAFPQIAGWCCAASFGAAEGDR